LEADYACNTEYEQVYGCFVKENPGLHLAHLQNRIVMLRKEKYRLTRIAADEYESAAVRSKAQDGAYESSLAILKTEGVVKRLEEKR
jgi:hypothetical protein